MFGNTEGKRLVRALDAPKNQKTKKQKQNK